MLKAAKIKGPARFHFRCRPICMCPRLLPPLESSRNCKRLLIAKIYLLHRSSRPILQLFIIVNELKRTVREFCPELDCSLRYTIREIEIILQQRRRMIIISGGRSNGGGIFLAKERFVMGWKYFLFPSFSY